MGGVVLELFSQMMHVNSYCAVVAIAELAPDDTVELAGAETLAWVLHEKAEHAEFCGRQLVDAAPFGNGMAGGVQREAAALQQILNVLGMFHFNPTQVSADARLQNLVVKRFRNVIVAAILQSFNNGAAVVQTT